MVHATSGTGTQRETHGGISAEMQICQTSADFMSRGSTLHHLTCGACAEICRACAQSCRQLGGADMQTCAETCDRCAESCARMAGSGAQAH